MKIKKLVIWSIALIVTVSLVFLIYKKFIQKQKKLPYKTEKVQRRTIQRIIDTTGNIRVSEKMKIGSLVTGLVKKLYVDENELVNKGQLLATIDTGKDDADVRLFQGVYEQKTANYKYQKNYHSRQKVLYLSGQLSKDSFERIERDFLISEGEVKSSKAQLDTAEQELRNTRITSPQDGIVIKVGVSEGERVTTALEAMVLFAIAKDITKMEASLEIDESNIGYAKIGQEVEFTIDSIPNKIFRTKINEISYSPKSKVGLIYYQAIVPVDNTEKLLRPGLTVEAKVFVAKATNVLSVTSKAFMISSKVLEEIAKDLNYSFNPVDRKEYKEKQKNKDRPIETVWTVQRNEKVHSFVEKVVETNLTDDIYFEIISGLNEDDEVIVEIEESNYLEEVLKKAYGSRF